MNGIRLFDLFIPYYGLMIASGLLISGTVAALLVRRAGLDTDLMFLLAAYGLGGGVIGAKLLYLLQVRDQVQWERMLEPAYFKLAMQGGFVFYGGLIGGAGALLLAAKIHRIKLLPYLQAALPALPIAHGFGRIGCSLGGCCYGIPYQGMFHIVYHNSLFAPRGIPLFPVQLLEAGINFAVAAILILMIFKGRDGLRCVTFYLTAYSISRFLLEYLRYDDRERGILGIFSTSQWISIAILAVLAISLLIRKKHAAGKNIANNSLE